MRNLFVVVNWNNPQDTLKCIHSLFEGINEAHDVMLIDNASDDLGYLDGLSQYGDRLHILKNDSNLGFTDASNQGFEHALASDYEFVSFINNDAYISRNFHSELSKNIHYAKEGMIACKILSDSSPDRMDNAGHQMLNTGEIIPIGHGKRSHNYRDRNETMGSCAAASVYSCEMIKDIGLYDKYFTTGYEDAEFGLRAILCGYRSIYIPELEVRHKISASVAKVDSLDYRIQQQVNIYYSYFKLMPFAAILISIPSIIIKYLVVILTEIILFKWSYVMIHFKSFNKIMKEWALIMRARHDFMKDRQLISSGKVLAKQKFFLAFDLKRLFGKLFTSRLNTFDKSLNSLI